MPEDCGCLPTRPRRASRPTRTGVDNGGPAKGLVGVNNVRVVFEDVCCHAFLEATNVCMQSVDAQNSLFDFASLYAIRSASMQ